MSGQYSLGTGEQSLLRMLGISPGSVTVNARTAMGISTFYACVRVKSEMLASLPFGVYRKLEGGGSESLSDHPLSEILRTRANPAMGDFVARRMMLVNYCVYGAEYKEVNESFSTVTCSGCKSRSGPKGLSGLKVREWVCPECGECHSRDANAAKNILSFSVQGIAPH